MDPGPSCVEDLRIWQEGMALVKESYALTATWPRVVWFDGSDSSRGGVDSLQSGGRPRPGHQVRNGKILANRAWLHV